MELLDPITVKLFHLELLQELYQIRASGGIIDVRFALDERIKELEEEVQ